MKRNNIIIFIYDDKLYINSKQKTEIIKLKSDAISMGRINNMDNIIKSFKKSSIIKKSIYKLVEDNILFIYLANYNNYELSNIKESFREEGFSNIKLIDSYSILNNNYEYLFLSNDTLYHYHNQQKVSINKNNFELLKLANSKIITNKNAYDFLDKEPYKTNMYVVDDLFNYLIRNVS